MASLTANGVTLEYEETGPPDGPPVLLIMGLGAQLVFWPDSLVDGLAGKGFHVIRYDNRDVGLSTKFDEVGVPSAWRAMLRSLVGLKVQGAPYTLDDMADDGAGLLDALGIEAAHVVGASMGGMIGQVLALRHPAKVRSFACLISSTGDPKLPKPRPRALLRLLSRPKSADRETVVEHKLKTFRIIAGPQYPPDEALLREMAGREFDRCFNPHGITRQTVGILASESRLDVLKNITAPTLVVHGADDPLLPAAHGRDVARRIPGAQLEILDGMGHQLPEALIPRIVESIAGNIERAGGAPRPG